MERSPSDTLFISLYADFPYLGEHIIRRIIDCNHSDVHLSYEACQKLAAASGSPQHPCDFTLQRFSTRAPPAAAAVELAEQHKGRLPDWRGSGPPQSTLGMNYDSMVTALASPRHANGSAMPFSQPGAGVNLGMPERSLWIHGLHRHSEPTVNMSHHPAQPGGAARPASAAAGYGSAFPASNGPRSDTPLHGSPPPVNGMRQLRIVTGGDNSDIDDSWTQVGHCDSQQAHYYNTPRQQYGATIEVKLRPGSSAGGGPRQGASEEFLEAILIQQRMRKDKCQQAIVSLEDLLASLQIEEAHLTDEIKCTHQKAIRGSAFFCSSTEQEMKKLRLEQKRLAEEVQSLQNQCDTLALSTKPSNPGRTSPPSWPVSSADDRRQFGGQQVAGANASGPPNGSAATGYGGRTMVGSNLFSLGTQPHVVASRMPTTMQTPPLPGHSTSPRFEPPGNSALSPRPPIPQLQRGAVTPPLQRVAAGPPQRHTAAIPLQRQVGVELASASNGHADEGENWNCTACTFLNHPTLGQCEMCDTPRM